ncbi:alpha-glucan family phosphorylase [Patescibacteria group bacterium]
MSNYLKVAYFTMEIGLDRRMQTFAGGLGMLAADLMKSCADMSVPTAGMTICWKHGYMQQTINPDGTQNYSEVDWNPGEFMEKLPETVTVQIEGRDVHVGVWKYNLEGINNFSIPIYFLDTDIEENNPEDRGITHYLYGGDKAMRIKQEIVLGVGGVRILRALGYDDVRTFHLNEGHAAFLTLEVLRERDYKDENVRPNCAFTTHTPVKAGHDVFDYDLAHKICGDLLPLHIKELAGQKKLSMTKLAIHLCHYTCGVAKIHGDVSRNMFPGEDIDYITNGVHHLTWAHPAMEKVLDQFCPGWRNDPEILTRTCRDIPDDDLWDAHMIAKNELIEEVNNRTNKGFDPDILTIASARRVVPYKRPELIYENLERLQEITTGKVQIIHAGNAHPNDPFSQGVIERMVKRSNMLKDTVKIAYLENYNPDLAKKMVSGADVWLNTPQRLHEASGTSGMKACLNGALNVSTLDGWWIEGFERDPQAGWRIGPLVQALESEQFRVIDAEDVYTQLQYEVIPEFYFKDRIRWIRRMKRSIGLIGFFNTNRCIKEYLEKAWIE